MSISQERRNAGAELLFAYMNDMTSKYSVFAPPDALAKKLPRDWSNAEAQAYRDWLLSHANARVETLLNFMCLQRTSEPDVLLHEAQIKLENLFSDAEFVENGPTGKRLTQLGYAIAADLGLLVAQLIIEATQGKVHWKILTKPKSDTSFNLPVLEGFGATTYDPIAVSIADATWILRSNYKPDAWVKVYRHVVASVPIGA